MAVRPADGLPNQRGVLRPGRVGEPGARRQRQNRVYQPSAHRRLQQRRLRQEHHGRRRPHRAQRARALRRRRRWGGRGHRPRHLRRHPDLRWQAGRRRDHRRWRPGGLALPKAQGRRQNQQQRRALLLRLPGQPSPADAAHSGPERTSQVRPRLRRADLFRKRRRHPHRFWRRP